MEHLEFWSILKPFKVIITSLNVTKLGFVRKFRPKRFHKIDPRSLWGVSIAAHEKTGEFSAKKECTTNSFWDRLTNIITIVIMTFTIYKKSYYM
jgi:hypothetical protein